MFTNSISKIFLVLLVLAVAAASVSFVTSSTLAATADRSYDSVEQMRVGRTDVDSSYIVIEQIRAGRTFNASADRSYDSVEQLRADRFERKEQSLSDFQPGKRYGGTDDTDRLYDKLEALRLQRYAATGVTDPVVLKELAQVRQATAKYHDMNVALAAGFVRTPNCVESPDGGMGIHFVNPARIMDPAISLLEPEILLYIETEGGMKLIGVEYMFPIGAPDALIPNPAPPAPILFRRPFDGPMLGHEPGMPPHYDLHVWIWQANPTGIFAPFNPNVNCP